MASIRTRGELAATYPNELAPTVRRVRTVTQRQPAYVASWRWRVLLRTHLLMASIRARGELAVIDDESGQSPNGSTRTWRGGDGDARMVYAWESSSAWRASVRVASWR